MADLRDLCARMADELDRYRQLLMDDRSEVHALATEARAALAEPEPEGPTDEELCDLMYEFTIGTGHGSQLDEIGFARAVLARWGNRQELLDSSPADGEVAELVAWMRNQVTVHEVAQTQWAKRFVRAASLLERLSPPQPAPVSERLPEPKDCDAEGMCWWYCAPAERWLRCGIPEPNPASQVHTHWLPAHALPLPS